MVVVLGGMGILLYQAVRGVLDAPPASVAAASPGHAQAALALWIGHARSVTKDAIREKADLDDTYAMVLRDSPAWTYLNAWYETHDPMTIGKHGTVSLQGTKVLADGDGYHAEWEETARDLAGHTTGTKRWAADLNVSTVEGSPSPHNPSGIYVTDVLWSPKT
jgi:type IV secretory pathway TrbF-like protein